MVDSSVLVRLGRAMLDAFFPPRCAVCAAYGSFLCPSCQGELTPTAPPRCPICWRPHPAATPCRRCRQERPAFQGARSPYLYQGPARQAVLALKYNHLSAIAQPMAELMARYLEMEKLVEADILVAVPLYGRRQRWRGYNQSALLAQELSRLCGWPLAEGALHRSRDTPPQARAADVEARRRNVADAFLADRRRVEGKRVLLIDDVMTTGATLDACARALRQAGAASVWALTFARED